MNELTQKQQDKRLAAAMNVTAFLREAGLRWQSLVGEDANLEDVKESLRGATAEDMDALWEVGLASHDLPPAAECGLLTSWLRWQLVVLFDPAECEARVELPLKRAPGTFDVMAAPPAPAFFGFMGTPSSVGGSGSELLGFLYEGKGSSRLWSLEAVTLLYTIAGQWRYAVRMHTAELSAALCRTPRAITRACSDHWPFYMEQFAMIAPQERSAFGDALRGDASRVLSLLSRVSDRLAVHSPEAPEKGDRPAVGRTQALPAGVWRVPVRVGSPLMQEAGIEGAHAGTGGGNSVRPHVRRGHMHTFLVGRGRSRREVRWVDAIAVQGMSGLVGTVRPMSRATDGCGAN